MAFARTSLYLSTKLFQVGLTPGNWVIYPMGLADPLAGLFARINLLIEIDRNDPGGRFICANKSPIGDYLSKVPHGHRLILREQICYRRLPYSPFGTDFYGANKSAN